MLEAVGSGPDGVTEQIPDDWEILKLADVCRLRRDSVNPAVSADSRYVGLEHIDSGAPKLRRYGSGSDVKSAKSRFFAGDVLYGKLRPYLDKAALAEWDGICSTDILVFTAIDGKIAPEFLVNLLHLPRFVDHAVSTTSGVNHPRTTWGDIGQFSFYCPSLPEQRAIAHVLSRLQAAAEAQAAIAERARELKRALMAKLFTEGLRGEPLKETEIGPVPESWEVVRLGDCLALAQYGLSVRGAQVGQYPILRMTNQQDGAIAGTNLQYVDITDVELERFRLKRGELLFNRTNSIELVGRTALFDLEGDYVFASYLIRLAVHGDSVDPRYLNFYLNDEATQTRLKGLATRGVSQSNISASRLKTLVVPLPTLGEQREMAAVLQGVDAKSAAAERKRAGLEELFRALLRELMTGRKRLHDTLTNTPVISMLGE